MELLINIGILIIGIIIGYVIKKITLSVKEKKLEGSFGKILEVKKQEGEKIILSAKEKALKVLEKAKEEEKERLANLRKEESRLREWERKLRQLEESLNTLKENFKKKTEEVLLKEKELEDIRKKQQEALEKIAKLKKSEAKEKLFKDIEKEYEKDIKDFIKSLEEKKKEIIEKKAIQIMLDAMSRYAPLKVEEYSSTTVELPNDEIKGKIIGKEGRNIKVFQRITGVDLIIDDTPNVVTISSFNPLRRELAKETLLRLIKDGRIQPARIEEIYNKVKEEFQDKIKKLGEEAVDELKIDNFPQKLIYLIGMMNFRTSYGQNLLRHSIEVAHICNLLAQELGLDSEVCKRAGLLHDIGKVLSHDIEGSHTEIGKKILEKFDIDKKIIDAVYHHHDSGYNDNTPIEAKIVQVADAISSVRPGARKESYEAFIKRVENLEKIVNSFEGVENSYVISAGREIRVFVNPKMISDIEAMNLARNIAKKIEEEVRYPGEIKINVIRETRVIEYAR